MATADGFQTAATSTRFAPTDFAAGNDLKKLNALAQANSYAPRSMQAPKPRGDRPAIPFAEKMAGWFHWLLAGLLAGAFTLVFAVNCLSLELPGRPGWPEALLLLLAAASTITALARQLPLQNVLLAAGHHRAHGRRGPCARRDDGNSLRAVPVRRGDRTALFKTLPWALPLIWVRGHFEFARRGAADLAAVAKNPQLRLLAHRG